MKENFKIEFGKMDKMARDADACLAKLAKEAIEAGDVEAQMATISTPFMGIKTLGVYMQEAENPNNCVYPMREAVAADPTKGDCILSILAELAVEFHDQKMADLIKQNPSAGVKTKEILGIE